MHHGCDARGRGGRGGAVVASLPGGGTLRQHAHERSQRGHGGRPRVPLEPGGRRPRPSDVMMARALALVLLVVVVLVPAAWGADSPLVAELDEAARTYHTDPARLDRVREGPQ